MKKKNLFTLLFAVLFVAIVVAAVFFSRSTEVNFEPIIDEVDTVQIAPATPKLFGIEVDTFEVIKGKVKNGDSFGKLANQFGIGPQAVYELAASVDSIVDVKLIKVGNDYTFLKGKHAQKASFFIYEESLLSYYMISLKDSLYAERGQRKKSVLEKRFTGTITSSLYETFAEQDVSPALAVKLSEVYAWTIDFFRIQKGDSITLIYEDIYVDDTIYAGTGHVLASRFDHFNEPYYAIRYTTDKGITEYYDEEGKNLRKAFLRAPLEFSRISSRYTQRRFHPVQKRWKAHLGTDYAAPRGTPIMTTADGVVEKAGYTSGNGNYVKVRHNSTYSTQYLHMSKIKKGMKPGVRVRQGEVIGYVGSTGLATGPHVCYRFWVRGKQVDPYKQKLPDADPIDEAYRADYLDFAEEQISSLNGQ